MGDGGTIPNLGQSELNLTDEIVDRDIKSVFQIAAVTRPLMSVGRLCDVGMQVLFGKDKARVIAPDGAEVCVFERSNGGLYLCKFRLKKPPNPIPSQPFGRQGR